MADYKKLMDDLIRAKVAAQEAAKGEDGGTANLDTLTIALPPGFREKKTIETIRAAGLSGRKRNWLGPRYFIQPPCCGQGNSRMRATEAMYQVMKEAGYAAVMYYQID